MAENTVNRATDLTVSRVHEFTKYLYENCVLDFGRGPPSLEELKRRVSLSKKEVEDLKTAGLVDWQILTEELTLPRYQALGRALENYETVSAEGGDLKNGTCLRANDALRDVRKAFGDYFKSIFSVERREGEPYDSLAMSSHLIWKKIITGTLHALGLTRKGAIAFFDSSRIDNDRYQDVQYDSAEYHRALRQNHILNYGSLFQKLLEEIGHESLEKRARIKEFGKFVVGMPVEGVYRTIRYDETDGKSGWRLENLMQDSHGRWLERRHNGIPTRTNILSSAILGHTVKEIKYARHDTRPDWEPSLELFMNDYRRAQAEKERKYPPLDSFN